MYPDLTRQTPPTLKTGRRTVTSVPHHSGFSLMELLLVVVIIGIVAAIAVPGYTVFITKANRSDAMNFLSEVAGEQQRYYSQNNQYASSMSELGYGTQDTAISPEAHYSVSITIPNDVSRDYLLTATPVADGPQNNDDECKSFTLNSSGAKRNTGGSSDNCW